MLNLPSSSSPAPSPSQTVALLRWLASRQQDEATRLAPLSLAVAMVLVAMREQRGSVFHAPYLTIADWMGTAWPERHAAGAPVFASEATVQRHLSHLVRDGIIERKRQVTATGAKWGPGTSYLMWFGVTPTVAPSWTGFDGYAEAVMIDSRLCPRSRAVALVWAWASPDGGVPGANWRERAEVAGVSDKTAARVARMMVAGGWLSDDGDMRLVVPTGFAPPRPVRPWTAQNEPVVRFAEPVALPPTEPEQAGPSSHHTTTPADDYVPSAMDVALDVALDVAVAAYEDLLRRAGAAKARAVCDRSRRRWNDLTMEALRRSSAIRQDVKTITARPMTAQAVADEAYRATLAAVRAGDVEWRQYVGHASQAVGVLRLDPEEVQAWRHDESAIERLRSFRVAHDAPDSAAWIVAGLWPDEPLLWFPTGAVDAIAELRLRHALVADGDPSGNKAHADMQLVLA